MTQKVMLLLHLRHLFTDPFPSSTHSTLIVQASKLPPTQFSARMLYRGCVELCTNLWTGATVSVLRLELFVSITVNESIVVAARARKGTSKGEVWA